VGSWYPGTREGLQRAVDAHLAAAVPSGGTVEKGCPRALIAPHAGLMYSGLVAAYAYQLIRSCAYDAVVLVGPSHFVGFEGAAIWPRGAWQTPFGALPVAEDIAATLRDQPHLFHVNAAAHGREHSLEMQLPFVARLLPGVPIVPIVMGYQTRATAEALGDGLVRACQGRRALLVASSDLSHYHDARTAGALDAVVMRHVEALDPDGLMRALENQPEHACGGGPMVAVLRAARALGGTRATVLRYADSGDVSGDKDAVVGYMAAAVW
jgi:AmmeMemoRadiSam system protein B